MNPAFFFQDIETKSEENVLNTYNSHWLKFKAGSTYLDQLFGFVYIMLSYCEHENILSHISIAGISIRHTSANKKLATLS